MLATEPFRDQWDLYWTTRSAEIPSGLMPLLDEWSDIDGRERRLGIESRTPILIDPQNRVDPRLAVFFRRSRFCWLAEGSRTAYAKDYRLFFSFLWLRGKNWDEADSDDLDDYEAWRRRSPDNPSRIGGAKWQRELAAFKLLYDWAASKGHLERSPVTMHTVRTRDGSAVEVAANTPKDVRASNVKWVTPRTYRLWRDIGLRGYTAAGLPEQGWRGRNDGRNVAFADLLFESGLRLREAGRARHGLARVLDIETARAMADYLDDLAERVNKGEGVSGPAAQRMIKAARDASTRFKGMFLSPRQADALLDELQFNVYDNPEAFLTCNNDPSKALCHPERTRRSERSLPPAIDRCDPACANIARTDTHITALQHEIAQLDEEIASSLTPTPLRERLRQRATTLRAIVDRHQRTRVVLSTRAPDQEDAG